MRCFRPLKAGYNSAGDLVYSRTGWSNELVGLDFPCRKCIACLLNQAREKAVRCWHESKMWEESIFLTLTYRPEDLRSDVLVYEDFQLFMKSLLELVNRDIEFKENRKKIPFMVTGEYGSQNFRPHWHALLFNYRPQDAEYLYTTDRGDKVYRSDEIDSVWKRGAAEFGAVTLESAGYVARYGAKALIHGQVESRFKPIHHTSKRHALGKAWIQKNYRHTLENGFVVMPDGTRGKIPRYYIDWAKKNVPDFWERYVTQVLPQVIIECNERQEREEQAWIAEWKGALWSEIKGLPKAPSQIKHTILSRKFKQLQEKLKL